MVPVRNGGIPDAPEGGHITHSGTLVEGTEAALPEDPPELVEEGAPEGLDDGALVVRTPDADVVAAEPDAGPAIAVPDAAADAGWAVVAGARLAPLVVTVEAVALLPRVTTPLFVTLYGVAEVCAKA